MAHDLEVILNPDDDGRNDDRDDDLHDAVFGRPQINHAGLVTDTKTLRADLADERVRRAEGDKRIWDRVEVVARKVDRIIWVSATSGLVGAVTGGGLVTWLMP